MLPRLSTTLRIALISALLAFVANASLIGYVRYTTQTSALADMRDHVIQEGQTLREAISLLPPAARERTLQQNIADADPDFVAGLFDPTGRQVSGNAPARLPTAFLAGRVYEVLALPPVAGTPPVEAGLIAHSLDTGGWLVSGRRFGDALSLARTLERALLLATLLAIVFGVTTGLAVAAYVDRRVNVMVHAIDEIGRGDFAMRLPVRGSRDGFDLLATRINLMLDRIDRLMRELLLVTDSLAHDLRSPIGRLRTKVELAIALHNMPQRNELLGSALLDADSLTRQLTMVLEIGRAEAMIGTDRFEPVDLGALTREIADLYEPVAEEGGIEIAVMTDPDIRPVRAHRQLLSQALGNLIDNAILHAGSGHSLTVFANVAQEGVSLGVADRGPGIAPEERTEARRRFGRLDGARSSVGAGLGLSLVEAVAHLHHGQLLLEDNQPGLRASLAFPIGGSA